MRPGITMTAAASTLVALMGCTSHDTHLRSSRYRNVRSQGIHAETYEAESGFGYVGFGAVADSTLVGDFEHVDPGTGMSLTMPLAPGAAGVIIVAGVAVLLAAALSGGGTLDLGSGGGSGSGCDWDPFEGDEAWDCGVAGSPMSPLSETSLDATISTASHYDSVNGRDVDYTSLMFGGKIATSRVRLLRAYATLGYGFYWLDGTTDGNLAFNGPYAGWGVDVVPHPQVTVGVDWRRHLFLSGDEVTDSDSGATQTILNVNLYW